MTELHDELRETIREASADLWRWRGVNPYVLHPLEVLGFAQDEKITVARINSAKSRIEARAFHEGETSDDFALIPPTQAASLLMNPVTRVVCELLRIPPVRIPTEDMKRLRELARELRPEGELEIPDPDPVEVDSSLMQELFVQYLADDPPSSPELEAPDYGEATDMPPSPYVGIEFKPRRTRQGG